MICESEGLEGIKIKKIVRPPVISLIHMTQALHTGSLNTRSVFFFYKLCLIVSGNMTYYGIRLPINDRPMHSGLEDTQYLPFLIKKLHKFSFELRTNLVHNYMSVTEPTEQRDLQIA